MKKAGPKKVVAKKGPRKKASPKKAVAKKKLLAKKKGAFDKMAEEMILTTVITEGVPVANPTEVAEAPSTQDDTGAISSSGVRSDDL